MMNLPQTTFKDESLQMITKGLHPLKYLWSIVHFRTGSKLGISPLMLAAMNGHTQAVKLLLDMGSDINAQVQAKNKCLVSVLAREALYVV